MSNMLEALTKSLVETYADKKSYQEKQELIKALEAMANHARYNKFAAMFPDEGEFARYKYKKHMEFIKAGASYRERLLIAGNRVGKSELGAYELTCHATGNYPEWWNGRRFTRPIKAWVGGDTSTTVRDIIQNKLLGGIGDFGSGMINKALILDTKTKRNVPDAIETILVQHKSGGVSSIVLKTYEQGRETWQGTEIDLVWLDEEPPIEIYSESLIRTMTTNGMVMLTFTPLRGLSDVVLSFMEADDQSTKSTSKCTVTATWADAPHLTEEAKNELRSSIPPNERDARENGNPVLGSGRIYPFQLDAVVVSDFPIPKYWAKAYGMDVGWNKTAAIFGALDRDADILYIYSEHYAGESEPMFHAKAVLARGAWMKGVIDPASHGRSQIDGQALFDMYMKEGLKIRNAENAVEAGIFEVWQRLQTGRLKIFKSCTNLLKELSLYHRNEKGAIVKKNDHLCLSATTQVKTRDGFKYVSDLTETDEIYTYSGKLVKSSKAVLVKKKTPFLLIKTDTKEVEATPDHCLLGSDGIWYPACLSKGISLLDMDALWKQKDYQQDNKNLMEKLTGSVENTFSDMEQDFIEQFGNITTEKYQQVITYITEILIEEITASKTWNVLVGQNTYQNTWCIDLAQEKLESLAKKITIKRPSGMDQKKELNGTNKTTKEISNFFTEQLNVSAHIAEELTVQLRLIMQQLFVAITASQPIDVVSKKILKHVIAVYVEKNLQQTNILRQKRVVKFVAARNLVEQNAEIKQILPIGNKDAWCIYEAETNSFILDNGLVSSNCDCLRYLTLSGLRVASCQLETIPRKDNVISWQAWG